MKVILVTYADSKAIDEYFRKLRKLQISPDMVIHVRNKGVSQQSEINPLKDFRSTDDIEGSNLLLDFSGYLEGLLVAKKTKYEPLIVMNDSIFTKHCWEYILKRLISTSTHGFQYDLPILKGFTEQYWGILPSNPWSKAPRYLPSFAFSVNKQGARFLEELLQEKIDEILKNTAESFVDGLPDPLKYFLKSRAGIEEHHLSWRGADDSDLKFNKACCIYLEHYISGKFQAHGALDSLNQGFFDDLRYRTREVLARRKQN